MQASPPSGDMAKLSVEGTPTAKVRIEPIAWSLLAADAPGITTDQSNDVQRVVQSLMDRPWKTWFPQVCISYSTGTRQGTDAQGTGPGMLRAAAITHALYNAGIACASGLCIPAGCEWTEFLPKIHSPSITHALYNAGIACTSGLCVPCEEWKDFLLKIESEKRFSRCKVLIVLLSPAFYNSPPCLLEAYTATKVKGLHIIPLRCADKDSLPDKEKQWPYIGRFHEHRDRLEQVQRRFAPLNALPPRGCFFDPATPDNPHPEVKLEELVRSVLEKLQVRELKNMEVLKNGAGEAGVRAGAHHT